MCVCVCAGGLWKNVQPQAYFNKGPGKRAPGGDYDDDGKDIPDERYNLVKPTLVQPNTDVFLCVDFVHNNRNSLLTHHDGGIHEQVGNAT